MAITTEVCLTVLLGFALVAALVAVEARDLLASAIAAGVVALSAAVAFLLLGAPDLALLQLAGVIAILVVLVRGSVVREGSASEEASGFATAVGLATACVLLVVCTAVFVGRDGKGLPRFGKPVALEPYDTPDDARARLEQRRKDNPRALPEERGVSRLYLDQSWDSLQAAENRRVNLSKVADEKYQPLPEGFEPRGGQLHLGNRVTAVLLDYRGLDALAAIAAVLACVMGVTLVLRRKREAEGQR